MTRKQTSPEKTASPERPAPSGEPRKARTLAATAGIVILSLIGLIVVALAAPFIIIGSALTASFSKGAGRWRAAGA